MKNVLFALCVLSLAFACTNKPLRISFSGNMPQVNFAAQELKEVFQSKYPNQSITIHLKLDTILGEQAFKISSDNKKYVVLGGDETGLMYGALELAERVKLSKSLPNFNVPVQQKPFVKRRGLKFNIPLDIRTPSYQDAGDAAQNNIAEMWNFEFWKAYLDRMALYRYNVLTLWNPHPFPSMIKMDNYPGLALNDVCGTTFPLDTDRTDEPTAKFYAGCGVSKPVLDHLTVLKTMSIDEKIAYWQKVMRYAKERGVDVYFVTWNIWMNSIAPSGWYREQQNKKGAEGKYGINNDQENPRTIAYLREAVKTFVLTYPDLAGIGITAGENMEDRTDEFDREKWLWASYGEGIKDAKKVDPNREVEFIHRYWQSGVGTIVDDFISKYPDKIALSFKYARARMYATAKPQWANEFINEYAAFGLKSWWNIRNDDIFHFRWGDPKYTSEFIKNLPPEKVTAGYFVGSDGYVWGREFISKHPQNPRELEIDKHWYNFMLWGRMGYNPNLDDETIKGMLANRYPGVPVNKLFDAWAIASQIPSKVTSFHWNSWDFQWAVEGCLDLRTGFHSVDRFIKNPTMDGLGILTIPEFVALQQSGKQSNGITPVQISNELIEMANKVLAFAENQKEMEGKVSDSYDELVYDLRAWAYMGRYYAHKIKGGCYLQAYRSKLGAGNKQKAVGELTEALDQWELYAAVASRNYKPQFMAKTRTIDWHGLTEDVRSDIEIAAHSTCK